MLERQVHVNGKNHFMLFIVASIIRPPRGQEKLVRLERWSEGAGPFQYVGNFWDWIGWMAGLDSVCPIYRGLECRGSHCMSLFYTRNHILKDNVPTVC